MCELSSDQMKVAQKSSREISFFAIAKLLQTSIVNLYRLDVFWRPITAHLVEVCGHSHVQLREWGSVALTQLVMSAMRQHIASKDKDTVCFMLLYFFIICHNLEAANPYNDTNVTIK